MFKPKEEKSNQSHEIINRAFSEAVGQEHKYTVAYGYHMKSGLFSKKVFNYAIGYSLEDLEIVIVTLDSAFNAVDKLVLPKESITSAKYGLQGGVTIKSTATNQLVRFTVPAFTAANADSVYMLPIIQEDQEKKLRKMIKEAF